MFGVEVLCYVDRLGGCSIFLGPSSAYAGYAPLLPHYRDHPECFHTFLEIFQNCLGEESLILNREVVQGLA